MIHTKMPVYRYTRNRKVDGDEFSVSDFKSRGKEDSLMPITGREDGPP